MNINIDEFSTVAPYKNENMHSSEHGFASLTTFSWVEPSCVLELERAQEHGILSTWARGELLKADSVPTRDGP